jgi:hypothetical protein
MSELVFLEFPKMARLSRDIIVTEKIDGTNAQILITEDGQVFAGSRKRWITPQSDNFGFAKWVEENKHPLYDLYIYNYSRRTQYEGKWDETTIQARGLILDGDGNVIAKAFDKFFNYSELPPAHKAFGILAKERAIILDKLDGSLGIIFHYDNKWNVATRGSFMSEQAIKGSEMLNNYNIELFNKELIYLVEICFKENTIVCTYDEDKLFFLSITKEMDELSWNECKKEFRRIGIPQDHITKEYGNVFNYQALKDSFEEPFLLVNPFAKSSESKIVGFFKGNGARIYYYERAILKGIIINYTCIPVVLDITSQPNEKPDLPESTHDQLAQLVAEHLKRIIDTSRT